jgi:hypothetical protein
MKFKNIVILIEEKQFKKVNKNMENKIVKTFFVLLVIDIISSTMMKKDGSKVVKPDQDQDCIHFLKTYFP